MAKVRFTRNLSRFFPDLDERDVEGDTVAALVRTLELLYPGTVNACPTR